MDFKQAVETCLRKKYGEFSGRASRSEFWWFSLFCVIVFAVIFILYFLVQSSSILSGICGLLILVAVFGLLVPGLAVSVRRLHDTGKSGWLILIGMIPIVSIIGSWVLLVFYVLPSNPGSNAYGDAP